MLRRQSCLLSHTSCNYKRICKTADEAISDITSGSILAIGGFGAAGSPHALCTALAKKAHGPNKISNLKLYTNAGSIKGYGIGLLFANHQVSRVACSHFGSNSFAEKQYLDGELEIEFTPQGSLAERMRAGGAGIPAFYTPTSAGTVLQEGGIFAKYCPKQQRAEKFAEPKETRIINGKLYVLEHAIHADFGLIKVEIADRFGNCILKGTSKNFNIPGAQCSKKVIVEAQKIVDYRLDPDQIHLPGVYVDRLVETKYETMVEHLHIREEDTENEENNTGKSLCRFNELPSTANITEQEHGYEAFQVDLKPKTIHDRITALSKMSPRERIQRRAALEIRPFCDLPKNDQTFYVNLGIGIPTVIPDFVPNHISKQVMLMSENGILGMGGSPTKKTLDPELINASKETVTAVDGASTFSSELSFGMIRSGRLDLTILGGLEVSEHGDLANWIIPGKMSQGPGGALDLIAATKRVVVVMTHLNKRGESKLLKKCDLPLTRKSCVHRVITEKAVFDFDEENDGKMTLIEVAPEYLDKIEELKKITEAKFEVSEDVKEMDYSWK